MNFIKYYVLTLATLLYLPLPAATPPKEEPPQQPRTNVREVIEKERKRLIEQEREWQKEKATLAARATTSTASGSLDDEEVAQKDVKTAAATTASTITEQPQKPVNKIPSLFTLAAAQQLYGLWTTSTDDFSTTLATSYEILEELPSTSAPAIATTSTQPQQPTTDSVDMRAEITRALQSILEKDHPELFFMMPAVLTYAGVYDIRDPIWDKQLTACAYTNKDGDLVVWKAATGKIQQITIPKEDRKRIETIALNPHGTLIAYSVGYNDNSCVRIIEPGTAQGYGICYFHNSPVDLRWNPQGDHLAIQMWSNEIMIWNRYGGDLPHPITSFITTALSAALPDEQLQNFHSYRLKNALGFIPTEKIRLRRLIWNPQGTLLASQYEEKVIILNTQAQQVFSIPGPINYAVPVSWNSQGTSIAYITRNNHLNIYDLETKISTPILQKNAGITSLSWNPVVNLLTWGTDYGFIDSDPKTKKTVFPIQPDSSKGFPSVEDLSWNHQGTLLAYSMRYNQIDSIESLVSIFNRMTQQYSYIPPTVSGTTTFGQKIIYWNPQGTRLAVVRDTSSDLYTIPEYTLDQLFFILGVNRLLAIKQTENSFYSPYRLQVLRSPIINTFNESYAEQKKDITEQLNYLFPAKLFPAK